MVVSTSPIFLWFLSDVGILNRSPIYTLLTIRFQIADPALKLNRCPITNLYSTTYMLRYVRHLMTKGCHGVSPSFLVYLLANKGTSSSRLFLRSFTILFQPTAIPKVLVGSTFGTYAATSYSSSTRNSSTLLMIYVASAKSASVLSSAFICLNCFNGQSYPLHVEYQLRYSRNQYAPI